MVSPRYKWWIGIVLPVAVLGCLAAAPADPVVELQRQIDSGARTLAYDPEHGYLASVLSALRVPVESQGLVFSKTSFQLKRISPQAPRALYFNDDVYVGWVQNGESIEIASVDPATGPVFYLLPQHKSDRPRFARQDAACMQCHQSPLTGDLPGLLMRSVYPDRDGQPVFSAGTFVTTEQSPMRQRWGGWYLDGKMPDLGMGNGTVADVAHMETFAPSSEALPHLFDASPYLIPHGDAVALLVLAHQTHLHNLMTKAATETRAALVAQKAIADAVGHLDESGLYPSTLTRIRSACEPVVQCLLFSGEAPLGAPVAGSTDFTRNFERLGPTDPLGRSLRQFDLTTRTFRYPCSYLIYSGQFDALPDEAKGYIYRRLWKVLTGRDDSRPFSHLSDPDRQAIYEILLETKKDLPAYWKPVR